MATEEQLRRLNLDYWLARIRAGIPRDMSVKWAGRRLVQAGEGQYTVTRLAARYHLTQGTAAAAIRGEYRTAPCGGYRPPAPRATKAALAAEWRRQLVMLGFDPDRVPEAVTTRELTTRLRNEGLDDITTLGWRWGLRPSLAWKVCQAATGRVAGEEAVQEVRHVMRPVRWDRS